MTKEEDLDLEDEVLDGSEEEATEEERAGEGGMDPAATATEDRPTTAGGVGAELATLREEFETLSDRHLRLAAEFNNFRRRTEQERLSAWSRAQADLVARFLDVLDDLHRVAELDTSNATVEGILEGIDLVERKFVKALEDADVEMLDPKGQPFDPEVMEAMMRVPLEDDAQDNTVAQVFQKGYALKGVLVRPARVSVYTS